MKTKPHSPTWYDNLAKSQAGYYYPWQSFLPPFHGEDIFLQMVKEHISTTSDLLEVACADGKLSLELASLCHSILGYDRIAAWIEQADHLAAQRGIKNATFICHDSSIEANEGQARLPAEDDSFDLLICRKGPFHWMEDARRVARSGATLLMLVPDSVPLTEWHSQLPESLRWQEASEPNWARPAIQQRLAKGGLALDSWWRFDVPETFPNPEQLYLWLSWGKAAGEAPSFAEIRPTLERVFDACSNDKGIEIRYHRYIWKAIVEK